MKIQMVLPAGAAVALTLTAGCHREAPPAPAPSKVEVMTVSPHDLPIYQEWIGTLDGYPNARINAQVTGYLIKQDYKEGSSVKKGDLLFEIDPRTFQAALDQAIAKEQQDEATLAKTKLDVERYTPLAKVQALSQEQLDDAVQANLAAKAAVVADQANVESASLNLGFTRIVSPVDGIAGLAQAQIGDLVGPGTGLLTTVSTVDPIRAYFNISEQSYLKFFRPSAEADAGRLQPENLPLELILSDGSVYPHAGTWIITGRQVDINTGTLQVGAVFDNPGNFLRPGQYARIRARTEIRKDALTVPQRAVAELQSAYQVAVVDATNTVHLQTVQVGAQVGSDWLILSGLQPNDRVIVEGTQKIREGARVDPEPYRPPSSNDQADPPPSARKNTN